MTGKHGAPTTTAAQGFGTALRAARQRAHLSQAMLAQRAKREHSTISRLESGDRHPSREMVLSLATALNLADSDRDTLLAAAGFQVMVTPDELVVSISEILADTRLSAPVMAVLRGTLISAVFLAAQTIREAA